jgi:hypothetical protein
MLLHPRVKGADVPGELTTTEFWDDYWDGVTLPTAVDPCHAFDRCFSAAVRRASGWRFFRRCAVLRLPESSTRMRA